MYDFIVTFTEFLGFLTFLSTTIFSISVVKGFKNGNSITVTVKLNKVWKFAIALSGNNAALKVTNETNANWSFKGRLFVAEYDENDCLLQIVAEDVDIALKNGETISVDGVFRRELTEGSTVKAFLWEPDDISPIIEAKVLR